MDKLVPRRNFFALTANIERHCHCSTLYHIRGGCRLSVGASYSTPKSQSEDCDTRQQLLPCLFGSCGPELGLSIVHCTSEAAPIGLCSAPRALPGRAEKTTTTGNQVGLLPAVYVSSLARPLSRQKLDSQPFSSDLPLTKSHTPTRLCVRVVWTARLGDVQLVVTFAF